MPNVCQQFKRSLEELHAPLSKAQSLLQEYARSGEEEKFQEMVSKVEEYERQFEEFKREYFEEVKRLLEGWLEWLEGEDREKEKIDFLNGLKMTEDGMIISQGNFLHPQLAKTMKHFPFLIQEFHNLFLNGPSISSTNSLQEVSFLQCDNCNSNLTLQQLRKIDEHFYLSGSVIAGAPVLREIGGSFSMYRTSVGTIEQFRRVFPELKRIGGPIFLYGDQLPLVWALYGMKDKGEIFFEEIVYQS